MTARNGQHCDPGPPGEQGHGDLGTDSTLEQAWQDLDAKIAALLTPQEGHALDARIGALSQQYAAALLRSAGAELHAAADALQAAAEQLKWAHKGKAANIAIEASRRAREAAQGLV